MSYTQTMKRHTGKLLKIIDMEDETLFIYGDPTNGGKVVFNNLFGSFHYNTRTTSKKHISNKNIPVLFDIIKNDLLCESDYKYVKQKGDIMEGRKRIEKEMYIPICKKYDCLEEFERRLINEYEIVLDNIEYPFENVEYINFIENQIRREDKEIKMEDLYREDNSKEYMEIVKMMKNKEKEYSLNHAIECQNMIYKIKGL
jgi:hypothetical protein